MNKMLKVFMLVLAVVSFTLGIVCMADAADAAKDSKDLKEKKVELKFSDAQKQQLKAVLAKYRPTISPMTQNFAKEQQELAVLVHADKLDDSAIHKKSEKTASLKADIDVQMAHIFRDLSAVLTPEQVKTAKEAGKIKTDFLLLQYAEKLDKAPAKK